MLSFRGRIHSVSRELISSLAIKDYADMRLYWKNVHGYQLPEQVGPVFVRCSLTLEDNLADAGIRTGELGCQ